MPPAGPPSLAEALPVWAGIGAASFGGPAAQIAMLHREIVERRAWVDEAEFQQALNLCMLLPGPEALQLAIYLGWRLHRVRGALMAGGLFLLPAVLLLGVLSWAYVRYGRVPAVAGALLGLEAAVVVLILAAVLRLGRRSLDTLAKRLIALGAFAALTLTSLPYPLLLGAAALLGMVFRRPERRDGGKSQAASSRIPSRPLLTLGTGIVLWLVPPLGLVAAGLDGVPLRLYLVLTRAALLTFGGAYAIVRYVSADFSQTLGWLTPEQSVVGLALAETTPGPLMIVLQYFGFMAGWNHPGSLGPEAAAFLCAALASYACFLPSFVIVLLAAPYLGVLGRSPRVGAALGGVTAFVVGVIASLGVTVAATVLLHADTHAPRWPVLALSLLTGVLLRASQAPLYLVMLVAAGAGLVATAFGFL